MDLIISVSKEGWKTCINKLNIECHIVMLGEDERFSTSEELQDNQPIEDKGILNKVYLNAVISWLRFKHQLVNKNCMNV